MKTTWQKNLQVMNSNFKQLYFQLMFQHLGLSRLYYCATHLFLVRLRTAHLNYIHDNKSLSVTNQTFLMDTWMRFENLNFCTWRIYYTWSMLTYLWFCDIQCHSQTQKNISTLTNIEYGNSKKMKCKLMNL